MLKLCVSMIAPPSRTFTMKDAASPAMLWKKSVKLPVARNVPPLKLKEVAPPT
jgi:hypothetical protein